MTDDFDRQPPNDLNAERCVVASMILSGGDRGVVGEVCGIVTKENFYLSEHGVIFQVIVDLVKAGKKVDAVILRSALAERKLLAEVGGSEQIGAILNSVPDWHHYKHYAQTVREGSILREMIRVAAEMRTACDAPKPVDTAPDMAMQFAAKLIRLATEGRSDEVHKLDEILFEVCEQVETGKVPRVPTGLTDLDRVIGGLPIGGKTVVGAEARVGKSTLAKVWARRIAARGIPVGVITIEETRRKWGTGLLAAESGIQHNRIAFANVDAREFAEIAGAVNRLAKLPIFVVDTARKLSRIIAAAHVLAGVHRCKVIVVDHVHIIDGEPGKNDNAERELSKISEELKWTWKDLDVAGVELAQFNRGARGTDGRPTLKSLRGSGSLEQDGDVIILLHREDVNREYGHDGILELLVLKNKDAAEARIPVNFDGARQRVTDHVADVEDVP